MDGVFLRPTRSSLLGVLSLVLVLSSLTPTAWGAPQKASPSSCDGVFEWVAANRDNLPRTYDEISTLHPAYRRAIYTTLSPEERSELWRTQFERYLASGLRLTKEQRGLLREALGFSTPLTFALLGERTNPERADLLRYLDDFEARSKRAFGDERSRAIFGMLGPASVEDMFFSAAVEPSPYPSPDPSPDPSPGPIACSCARTGDDCPKGYACTGNHACNRIVNGCGGVIFKLDCDGLCEQPAPDSDPDPDPVDPADPADHP